MGEIAAKGLEYWRHKAAEEIVPFILKARDILPAAGVRLSFTCNQLK